MLQRSSAVTLLLLCLLVWVCLLCGVRGMRFNSVIGYTNPEHSGHATGPLFAELGSMASVSLSAQEQMAELEDDIASCQGCFTECCSNQETYRLADGSEFDNEDFFSTWELGGRDPDSCATCHHYCVVKQKNHGDNFWGKAAMKACPTAAATPREGLECCAVYTHASRSVHLVLHPPVLKQPKECGSSRQKLVNSKVCERLIAEDATAAVLFSPAAFRGTEATDARCSLCCCQGRETLQLFDEKDQPIERPPLEFSGIFPGNVEEPWGLLPHSPEAWAEICHTLECDRCSNPERLDNCHVGTAAGRSASCCYHTLEEEDAKLDFLVWRPLYPTQSASKSSKCPNLAPLLAPPDAKNGPVEDGVCIEYLGHPPSSSPRSAPPTQHPRSRPYSLDEARALPARGFFNKLGGGRNNYLKKLQTLVRARERSPGSDSSGSDEETEK